MLQLIHSPEELQELQEISQDSIQVLGLSHDLHFLLHSINNKINKY